MAKTARITGVTGQNCAYIAEVSLGKGYEVHGTIQRPSTANTSRINRLYHDLTQPDASMLRIRARLAEQPIWKGWLFAGRPAPTNDAPSAEIAAISGVQPVRRRNDPSVDLCDAD